MHGISPGKTPKKPNEREWLDKWLGLKTGHSKRLQELEHRVFEFCKGYASNPRRGSRLVIHGNNGAGKSHTGKSVVSWANRVAMHLPLVPDESELEYRLAVARYVNWPAFLHEMKAGAWEAREALETLELLVLDDIGAEHDPSKVGAESLYLVLERREYRWTMITTNVKRVDWERKFERRISSRLLRNTIMVNVEDVPDFKTI